MAYTLTGVRGIDDDTDVWGSPIALIKKKKKHRNFTPSAFGHSSHLQSFIKKKTTNNKTVRSLI